uniref:hypothetical protein n=1 Tax=Burkholderia anthina TaxID=179879 RepID=UPI00158A8A0B|nr:hypothetical protein [Burkholderia anthina]
MPGVPQHLRNVAASPVPDAWHIEQNDKETGMQANCRAGWWLNAWLYSPGYEAQCQVKGSQLVCTGGNGWHAYRP